MVIYDINGEYLNENEKKVRNRSYSNGDIVMLCAAKNNRESFVELKDWLIEIKD